MGIAALYNSPRDLASASYWSFANATHHRDIIAAIYRRDGVQLTEYVLDPLPVSDMPTWMYHHAVMHQQMDAALGIAGFDLSEVDWDDEEALAFWLNQHVFEHQSAQTILGV